MRSHLLKRYKRQLGKHVRIENLICSSRVNVGLIPKHAHFYIRENRGYFRRERRVDKLLSVAFLEGSEERHSVSVIVISKVHCNNLIVL